MRLHVRALALLCGRGTQSLPWSSGNLCVQASQLSEWPGSKQKTMSPNGYMIDQIGWRKNYRECREECGFAQSSSIARG